MTKNEKSKSRHRDHRLSGRVKSTPMKPTLASFIDLSQSSREPTKLSPSSTTLLSSNPPPVSFIPDEVLEDGMNHLLQKNYTKTDMLTLSNTKAKDYVTDALAAQQQVLDRATRADTLTCTRFPDLEIRCV